MVVSEGFPVNGDENHGAGRGERDGRKGVQVMMEFFQPCLGVVKVQVEGNGSTQIGMIGEDHDILLVGEDDAEGLAQPRGV